ncbi:MAG TPA: SUMF1/EgtB/PvdO family nonheme iron enzyme [Candidatus Acidoferrales bacterium]|nr:SUMF1/EgtB/PvdO family nonheme iron enzyme [Candidatus Acidoferrales bacterium]
MSKSLLGVPVLSGLMALLLGGSPPQHSNYIELGKSRLVIVKIPAGTFRMGSDEVIHADDGWSLCSTCSSRNEVERPVHQVTISNDFWMGQFDVTQKQWQDVMGNNPSANLAAGPDAPVEQVSWTDVQSFLSKVNAMQNAWTLRLPTEAEWEYAARGGVSSEIYGPLDEIAWYKANGGGTTHPVGHKKPNAFGLYDMLGNVWQWCQGWFGPYSEQAVRDPQGAPAGDLHPTRGGCYYCDAVHERAARRNRDLEDHSSRSIGFRIVAVPRNVSSL